MLSRHSLRKRFTAAKASPRVRHLRTMVAPSRGSFASIKTTATDCHQARTQAESVTRRGVIGCTRASVGSWPARPRPSPFTWSAPCTKRRAAGHRSGAVLEELDAATTDAIVFSVARGWVVDSGRPLHLPHRCGPAYGGIALAQNVSAWMPLSSSPIQTKHADVN